MVFYHQVKEGKEQTQNIYLYSSQLYINLKSKFALAGNGGNLRRNVTYCKWLLEL